MAVIFFVVTSCSSSSEKERSEEPTESDNRQTELVGEWRNLSMIVRMPDSTVNVPHGQWEAVLGIKPIRTTFSENGSFVSEYRTLEDSVFMTSAGTWSIEGDTLSMVERGNENKYFYSITGDTIIFRGFLDWDEDGQSDDHYTGMQLKQ